MKAKWIVPLLAATGLLVALAAYAADTAKKSAAPDVQKKVVRVEVNDEDGPGDFLWQGDDDLGLLALGDDEGGGDRRIVIRERLGPGGMGMGRHRGMGMGMHRGMGMGRGMGMAGAFARLDLTEAQRAKLADLHERQQRKAIQARADMQIARLDLRKLMHADSPSATAINAQIDRLARMRADMQKSHVATFLEARSLLTPEQLKKLREGGPGGMGGMGGRRMMLHRGMGGDEPQSD